MLNLFTCAVVGLPVASLGSLLLPLLSPEISLENSVPEPGPHIVRIVVAPAQGGDCEVCLSAGGSADQKLFRAQQAPMWFPIPGAAAGFAFGAGLTATEVIQEAMDDFLEVVFTGITLDQQEGICSEAGGDCESFIGCYGEMSARVVGLNSSWFLGLQGVFNIHPAHAITGTNLPETYVKTAGNTLRIRDVTVWTECKCPQDGQGDTCEAAIFAGACRLILKFSCRPCTAQ